tara:strand:- start:263 stop:472 length:210 start_codon:yes stop_codon:yes gene_type:complete
MSKYMVFNYTDNLYATQSQFKTKKDANEFIKKFRKSFEKQGYYRDNRRNKISPKHIDLEVISKNFTPYR